MRYPADSVEIQSPSPSYVSPLDAAPNCGIQCIFIRWNEVCPSSPITPTFFWLTTWPHSTRLNPVPLYVMADNAKLSHHIVGHPCCPAPSPPLLHPRKQAASGISKAVQDYQYI